MTCDRAKFWGTQFLWKEYHCIFLHESHSKYDQENAEKNHRAEKTTKKPDSDGSCSTTLIMANTMWKYLPGTSWKDG